MTFRQAIARKEGNMPHHRNMRNNNPGNIVWGKFAEAHGGTLEEHKTPRFARFETMEAGWEAMRQLLLKHYKGLTIKQAIYKWAPPTENDSLSYVHFVCHHARLKADDVLTEEIINQ